MTKESFDSHASQPMNPIVPRLFFEPVHDLSLAHEFLQVFNSNPDFLANSEPSTGRRSFKLSDVESFLLEEIKRDDSRCLAIRTRNDQRLVGLACLLIPHPREPFPWLGLLLIDGGCQGRGYGAEALHALESGLQADGWPEVRIGVLKANPRARRFWEREGYREYEEALDTDQRPCWLMRKVLPPAHEGIG